MTYLLDTDTCIYALKQDAGVISMLLSKNRDEIIKTLRLIENFLRPLTIVDFTSDDAIAYSQVRARLERAGTPIGPLDTLIAAQAMARKLTLVSNNEREFRRMSGLHLEN